MLKNIDYKVSKLKSLAGESLSFRFNENNLADYVLCTSCTSFLCFLLSSCMIKSFRLPIADLDIDGLIGTHNPFLQL
jgi:hypothetical protein